MHTYKLKGVGPISYHLGGNFDKDADGTFCYGPRKYIEKIVNSFEKLFGIKPKEYFSPLEKGDHPEVDDSQELDEDGIKCYQSMIGALQWVVSLRRFDMSGFSAIPCTGHLDRVKRIYGYLKKFKAGTIRFRTGEPDYTDLEDSIKHDWLYLVYGNVKELHPKDAPKAVGKAVTTTTYVDANLYQCLVSGCSATGILLLLNGTPIDWYSKRQATVETVMYGSEFVAAQIATDQIIDLRTSLHYMGVPVKESYTFGDNQAVVTSSTIPHSKLTRKADSVWS